MHKEIEKAVFKIMSIMEKNRTAYNEAKDCYSDTGYDRYWNKMEKLESEYEELRSFIHAEEKTEVTPETVLELDRIQRILQNAKSKWEYIRDELPVSTDTISMDDLFRDINK